MQDLACVPTPDGFLSPGVGVFVRRGAGDGCLGSLVRLGRSLRLTVPPGTPAEPCLPDGTRVMAGDRIATLRATTECPQTRTDTGHFIVAPADGYLVCSDDAGRPLLHPGDELHPGTIVAFVEFMKIRMEIAFCGPDGATFLRYAGTDRRSVRRGDAIAEYAV